MVHNEGLTRDGRKGVQTDLVGKGEGGDRVALAAVLVGFAAEDLLDQGLLAQVLRRRRRRYRRWGCWSHWGRSCVGVGEGEGDGLHFAAQTRFRLCSENQHTSTAMVVRAPFHGEHEGIL